MCKTQQERVENTVSVLNVIIVRYNSLYTVKILLVCLINLIIVHYNSLFTLNAVFRSPVKIEFC